DAFFFKQTIRAFLIFYGTDHTLEGISEAASECRTFIGRKNKGLFGSYIEIKLLAFDKISCGFFHDQPSTEAVKSYHKPPKKTF
ncbi:MAG: hypothetical protein CO148_09755, partial [Nitrospirae bacterium CG_4_9_14_3_um_filter_41_27]